MTEEEGMIVGIACGDIVGASGLARLGWMNRGSPVLSTSWDWKGAVAEGY